MADDISLQSPKQNYRQPTFSFFLSPRFFTGFVSKGFCSDSELSTMITSPTSILDSKPLKNPFCYDTKTPKIKNPWNKLDSRGLVDALIDEEPGPNPSKPDNRMVLFASQLKIQVPPLPQYSVFSPVGSPAKSPGDFGIKTRHSHVGSFSPSALRKSPFGSSKSGFFCSEMELSEDYTCVMSYGPNPKTTHIFDDCVVESCCGLSKMSYPSESFLSFCYNCRKDLGPGSDVYMYRGEKAFCSSECRCKEMMLEEEEDGDEGMLTSESEDVYSTSS